MEVVPAPVKETVLSLTKLPSVEKIKVGKEFWVVKAWDKKDTVLFGVDEVKSHIEAMLKNNQFKDVIEKRMEELKKELKVVINEDYFKDVKAAPRSGDRTSSSRPARTTTESSSRECACTLGRVRVSTR